LNRENLTPGIRAIPPPFPSGNFFSFLDLESIIETRHQKQVREIHESAMDESAKELLRQITGLIMASEAKVTSQLLIRSDAVKKSVESLASDFHEWRPRLENRVDDLQAAVIELQHQAAGKQPVGVSTTPHGGDPAAARLADARGQDVPPLLGTLPAGTDLGLSHGESSLHRGATPGVPVAPAFTPVAGTANFQTPLSLHSVVSGSENSVNHLLAHMGQANPSLQFPVFDGDNPQMWQTLAEQYFAMFSIHESYWVSMATLNFVGSPKIWLHSVQKNWLA
jgi:hypothetical protein